MPRERLPRARYGSESARGAKMGDDTAVGYRHRKVGAQELNPETLMMGFGYDPRLSEGALKCPIFHTSTFVFESAEAGKAYFELAYGLRERQPSEEAGLIYSRLNNPDLQVLEERLCIWDRAESGLVFSSGMSAITTTLLSYLRPGDVVLHSSPGYGGTDYLPHHGLPEFGITRAGSRAGHSAALEQGFAAARAAGRLRVICLEPPANPTNALVDIARCAELARSATDATGERPLVVVDNTFLGPLWQRPFEHGADLVLYSLTKYVGGHSDLIAGACLGPESLIAPVRTTRTIFGTMCDPMTGWLVLRSLETLKLRMTSSLKNARYVAEYLRTHPKVRTVHYLPFLPPDSPDGALYQKQCLGAGSTFSFEVQGGEAEAFRLLNALQVVKLAVSLGGTESLAEHPASMTHSDVPPEERAELGVSAALVRISVGIENPDDVIADLAQALEQV
ncbi:MAG: cystathionine gamma-synthase family protein [Gemmatimonadetes bacterium]|nr:cystathionine gamma-synthase family protein [Gemmatimonadota bacterium]